MDVKLEIGDRIEITSPIQADRLGIIMATVPNYTSIFHEKSTLYVILLDDGKDFSVTRSNPFYEIKKL